MLTRDEEDYLSKIPDDEVVKICPFNPNIGKIVKKIITSIHDVYPNLEIRHTGASALGVSGQKDIDIYAFSNPKGFKEYLPGLTGILGKHLHKHQTFMEWKFEKEGYDIEFYLADPNSKTMKRQIKVFEILKNDKKLLKEYEELKRSLDGKSFKEYQKKKYEFYHRLLDSKKSSKR